MLSQNNLPLPQDLQLKIAQGDQTAFKVLFNLYAKKLMLFAKSFVRSNEAAREIVDEVFIKLWRSKETVPSIQNLKVYLYAAVKNNSLNFLSSKANQAIAEPFDFFEADVADGSPTPDQRVMGVELQKRISEAVNALPPRCKMVFKLIREDGLSYKEVGEILNISSKTVDAQMVIAVRQISEKVRPHFDFFPARGGKK